MSVFIDEFEDESIPPNAKQKHILLNLLSLEIQVLENQI